MEIRFESIEVGINSYLPPPLPPPLPTTPRGINHTPLNGSHHLFHKSQPVNYYHGLRILMAVRRTSLQPLDPRRRLLLRHNRQSAAGALNAHPEVSPQPTPARTTRRLIQPTFLNANVFFFFFRQLDAKSLAAATLVNRKWLRIIRSDRVLRRRLRESKRSYWRSVAQKGYIEPAKLPAHLRANFAQFAPPVPTVHPAPQNVFQPSVVQIQTTQLNTRRRNATGPVKSALKATAKKINNVLGSRPARLRF